MKLDPLTRQYLETALWSSTDTINGVESVPLDKDHDISDIAQCSVNRAISDCATFEELAKQADINLAAFGLEHVGHDFWLTRNHHGAGFWDGDYPDEIGKKLTEISDSFEELSPYIGDNGKIYIE